MKLYEMFIGYTFLEDPRRLLARQIRFPRSKRRRIRAKWARRTENHAFRPSDDVTIAPKEKFVIAHPATLLTLKAKIAESERKARQESGAAE